MTVPLRGTQSVVGYMGWVFSRPWLIAIEVGWRWIFGVPFLAVCFFQAQHILALVPLESSGLNTIDAQNPWIAVGQIARAWAFYAPHMAGVLRWLAPAAAVLWIVIGGLGRSLVLKCIDPSTAAPLPFFTLRIMALQAGWIILLGAIWMAWFQSMAWVGRTHILPGAEPELVGYAFWSIFLALGFFTLWALVSWPLSIAPLLMLLERRSALSSLRESLRLGKQFTGKLVEINLVMGIVNLALIVLAMVFSAAPLPFSDQLGSDALHWISVASVILYLVASDYFQVVRMKGFEEFWKLYRGSQAATR